VCHQVTFDGIQTQYSRFDERNETLGVMLAETISERGLLRLSLQLYHIFVAFSRGITDEMENM
jgi:hypothetical protein